MIGLTSSRILTYTDAMQTLKRSKDRKVTNGVTASGAASIANTFGLPSGKAYSCPGATSVCEAICYAGKLEKIYKGVRTNLLHNWNALSSASLDECRLMLSDMVQEFCNDCDRRGAEKFFRIHWDGDFFSNDYTSAWIDTVASFPDVRFWVYTRNVTSAVMIHKAGLDNLTLYFSADDVNLPIARMLHATYGIRLAYLSESFSDGQSVMRSITGKVGAKCPENKGSIPLISIEGSACARCRLCINGKADIIFSRSKK